MMPDISKTLAITAAMMMMEPRQHGKSMALGFSGDPDLFGMPPEARRYMAKPRPSIKRSAPRNVVKSRAKAKSARKARKINRKGKKR